MFRSETFRRLGFAATGVAVALSGVLALTSLFSGGTGPERPHFTGITLGLTAEAREALQQSGNAFPAGGAGFSAYHRVPDGAGGFSLDKAAVDQALFSDTNSTPRRAGIGTLVDLGGNYTIGRIPIKNIDGLTSIVNVYYDDQGWIVAYLPGGSESSQVWQAGDLNTENPSLNDVSRTTLLDAINDILEEALNRAPLGPDDVGYYHWGYPLATNFLLIATARGIQGSDFVSFGVPGSFTILETSVSMWISETNMPCARTFLDGANITGDQCDRSFHHVMADPAGFSSSNTHNLQLEHFNQDKGASGALLMLVYSVP